MSKPKKDHKHDDKGSCFHGVTWFQNKNRGIEIIVLIFAIFVRFKNISCSSSLTVKVLYFFIVLMLSGIVLAVHAEGLTEEEARERFPYAVVDMHEIDFGQLESGKPVTARLSISNEGSVDLQIAKARSSCGLMIQTWPSAPVKPGESVQLNFRFDSNRLGPFSRLITIHTNAWNKDLIVEVKGEVVPETMK